MKELYLALENLEVFFNTIYVSPLYIENHNQEIDVKDNKSFIGVKVNGYASLDSYKKTLSKCKQNIKTEFSKLESSRPNKDLIFLCSEILDHLSVMKSTLIISEYSTEQKPLVFIGDTLLQRTAIITSKAIKIHEEVIDKYYPDEGEACFSELDGEISDFLWIQYQTVDSLINYYTDFQKAYGFSSYSAELGHFVPSKKTFGYNDADDIRSSLLLNGVIETNDHHNFRRLFNRENKDLTEPIVWIGKESILKYFIKTLKDKGLIEPCDAWIVASRCFKIRKNGKELYIVPSKISRTKEPKTGINYKSFNKVFNFFK